MRREEAKNLIGKLVVTDLFKGGYYIGELVEVINSKPFRANVKVKGIYEYPSLYNHNTRPLTFKKYEVEIIKENEVINTGNGIRVFEENFISYNDSMKQALLKYLESVGRSLDCFIKNEDHYETCYINNMNDCVRLKNIILKKIEEIK